MQVVLKTTIDEVKVGKKGLAVKFGSLRYQRDILDAMCKMANEQMEVVVSISAISQPATVESGGLFDSDMNQEAEQVAGGKYA
jgi:hypothetical protein